MGFDILINNIDLPTTSLLLAGSVAASLFGFIGNININSDGNNINISGVDAAKELVNEQYETIDAYGVNEIKISNPVGEIKVLAGNDDKVAVVRKLYLPKATPDDEKSKIIDIFKQSVFSKHEDLIELTIPKMTVMEVITATADLEISVPVHYAVVVQPGVNHVGIEEIDGNVDVTNLVGNTDLKDLTGKVNAHSNSGNINLSNVKHIAKIESNVGDIIIKSSNLSEGNIEIHANTGRIDAEFQEVYPTTNARLTVNTGDMSVSLAKDSNANINLQTNMGQVFVDPAVKIVAENKEFMGGSIDAILNNGGGKLKLESNMGKLQVKLH